MHYFGGRSCVAKGKIGFNQTERNFLFQLEFDAAGIWGCDVEVEPRTHTITFSLHVIKCSPLYIILGSLFNELLASCNTEIAEECSALIYYFYRFISVF
jgi:hypothetical protein